MTLPDPLRGYAAPTWDTRTLALLIAALGGAGAAAPPSQAANDARYNPSITAKASGVVGWRSGSPQVATTTEAQVMTCYADVLNGRMYECAFMNVSVDQGNVKATEFRLKYTTDGSVPTNASATMGSSLRLSQFELGSIRVLYAAPSNQRLYLRASIGSQDGATVRSWMPGTGAVLMVSDVGIAPGQTGSAP